MTANAVPNAWIHPLYSAVAAHQTVDLQQVGGKGANLLILARAGFPVPDGFVIATPAYCAFVAANRLQERIHSSLPSQAADPEQLETASTAIRESFRSGHLPQELADEILCQYRRQRMAGEPRAVAVRSSATAEDLPDLSFAGQQDTYLNIVGDETLLKAVIECWSSLWTARAIGYRMRNGIAHDGVALAVVVQNMIESAASGVLFTANPLSGLRTETVIDATLGLGEALVSGLVDPDHYVVSPADNQIIEKSLGTKQKSIRSRSGGGVAVVVEGAKDVQALSDEHILTLAHLGQQVAAHYGLPQDIEWALADQLYLLQSRPVTSLYPTPPGMPVEPLKVMFSFAAVQGMNDPITPLGRSALCNFAIMGARLYNIRVNSQTQTVFFTAGERIWVNITALARNRIGRKALPLIFQFVEPTVRQALVSVLDDSRLQPGRRPFSLRALAHLGSFFPRMGFNIFLNLASPDARRKEIVANGEQILSDLEAWFSSPNADPHLRLQVIAGAMPEIVLKRLPRTFLLFVSGVASGVASFQLLNHLASGLPDELNQAKHNYFRDKLLDATRGLEYNPTTEMDLALWAAAQAISKDVDSYRAFEQNDSLELADRFHAGSLPPVLQAEVEGFLARYGGRGLAEIDIGRSRWAEDPTHVFEILTGYLKIAPGEQAPDAVFARGAVNAHQAIDDLVHAIRQAPGGWVKAPLARFFARRMRALMGMRESPKFFVVRMLWLLRRELLKVGQDLVRQGEINRPDDLMFMTFDELLEFASGSSVDWQAEIEQRRAVYNRELQRRQVPRLLLSDGRVFYEGLRGQGADEDGVMVGSPVSPGSVEGTVRVVFDPRQAGLQPGEIMVCPGTDPSWTPLFLTASGLVMEVGGMMTHGAVVAREYGIPAIVSVDRATERLQTGQRISIDGSSGIIKIIT